MLLNGNLGVFHRVIHRGCRVGAPGGRFAKVAPSTVARVEAGTLTPSLAVLERLLGAAGLYLVAVNQEGRVVLPMEVWDDTRDGAERRYPAHLN